MRRIAPRGNRTEDRGSRSSHKVLLKRKRPLQVEAKLKQILEDHKNIINISSEDTEEISKEQLASYEESK
jgi:hypothetical protein